METGNPSGSSDPDTVGLPQAYGLRGGEGGGHVQSS